jgi:hypothetical protein
MFLRLVIFVRRHKSTTTTPEHYVHTYLVMSNTSKTRKLVASSDATSVPFVDEAILLLARCLVSLDMIDGAYFYEAIGSASIPGSLSHLLCVTDQQLMTIVYTSLVDSSM